MIEEGGSCRSRGKERDFHRFAQVLTEDKCLQLQQKGYVVVDDCFGLEWASAFLNEIKCLAELKLMKPNETQFTSPGSNQTMTFSKPNIYEVDLHDANIRNHTTEFNALFESDDLKRCFQKHMPDIQLVMGTSGHTIKLQRNVGNGGCFPLHYDNPGRPNKRKLTCLIYLNPNWVTGDGGELEIQPFLGDPVVIPPLMDRMVVFYSDCILHRVLPSHAERYCMTIWLDGTNTNQDKDTRLSITREIASDWTALINYLQNSPAQRLLSRGVYEEKYLESLTHCMKSAQGLDEMVLAHKNHILAIQKNPGLSQMIARLRDYDELRRSIASLT